LLIVLDGSE